MIDGKPSYQRMVEKGRRDGAALIDVEHRGATAIVTMNDPASLNPLKVLW
ncbi:MAG TPA: hypothetical protein VG329_02245 [Candidatus Dormibacteraeota bacterium]|jgi:hypothetical protein|nr:hypothetical protein [Candidatus Dormibacteraeota bacterium]